MTKKIAFLAIGLSLVLLSGCGSSSNSKNVDNNNSGNGAAGTTVDLKNPSTLEAMKKSIVGSWKSACEVDREGVWNIRNDTFNSDNTALHEEKSYSESDCRENSFLEKFSANFTYTLGEKVKDSNNEDAFKFDIIGSDFSMYKIARIVNDKLYTSHHTDALDEKSDETRSNEINDEEGAIRQ